MGRYGLAIVAVACALTAVGCSRGSSNSADAVNEFQRAAEKERLALAADVSRQNRETQRNFLRDSVTFYERAGDAYFIIGYEYFNLARDLRGQGKINDADHYAVRAKIYHDLSVDLRSAANARRTALNALNAEDNIAPVAETERIQIPESLDAAPNPALSSATAGPAVNAATMPSVEIPSQTSEWNIPSPGAAIEPIGAIPVATTDSETSSTPPLVIAPLEALDLSEPAAHDD